MSETFETLSNNREAIGKDIRHIYQGILLEICEQTRYREIELLSFDTMSSYTLSPENILLDASSAPNSGALSNLTTPDNFTLESPDVPYINISPHSDTMEIDENWPSLFPPEAEEAMPVTISSFNSLQISPALHHVAPAMSRTSSSGQTSRTSHQSRPSTSSGVVKGSKSGVVKGSKSGVAKGSKSGVVKGSKSGVVKQPKSGVVKQPKSGVVKQSK